MNLSPLNKGQNVTLIEATNTHLVTIEEAGMLEKARSVHSDELLATRYLW